MSDLYVARLVQYGIETGLTPECEKNYTINLLRSDPGGGADLQYEPDS